MISFKFQVKTPFFDIYFITHLGKGHIFWPSTGILALTASDTASLYSGVDLSGPRSFFLSFTSFQSYLTTLG